MIQNLLVLVFSIALSTSALAKSRSCVSTLKKSSNLSTKVLSPKTFQKMLPRDRPLSDKAKPLETPHSSPASFVPIQKAKPNSLKTGDWLELKPGDYVQLGRLLGEGETNFVYDIGDSWALRINKRRDETAVDLIEGYVEVHNELKNNGVPVVELDLERSIPPYALVVKNENFLFTGDAFFAHLESPEKLGLTKKEAKKILEKLYQFAEKSWLYESISDVTPRQIGFNGKEWVLFDFFGLFSLPRHVIVAQFSQSRALLHKEKTSLGMNDTPDTTRFVPKEIEKEITERVNAIRKKNRKSKDWFERPIGYTQGSLLFQLTELPLKSGTEFKLDLSEKYLSWHSYSGLLDPSDLNFSIQNYVGEKNGYSIYDVLAEGQTPARLYVVAKIFKQSKSPVTKFLEFLDERNQVYTAGFDFVLIYTN